MADATAQSRSIPDGTLDRILEGLSRAWNVYLDDAKKRKLAELENPNTLLAFGVLIAIWTGAQFTVLGPLVDYAASVYGMYQVASTLGDLVAAAKEAAAATTDDAMNLAAQHMASALTDAAVDLISFIIAYPLFKTLRSAVGSIKTRFASKGIAEIAAPAAPKAPAEPVAERPATEPVRKPSSQPAPTVRRPILEGPVSGLTGVALAAGSPDLGQQVGQVRRTLNWLLPVLGGVAVVGGLVALVGSARS